MLLIHPQGSNAVFVLSVSKIDVEVLDLELLLYYIFKVIPHSSVSDDELTSTVSHQCVTSSTNDSRDFEIIFDFTGFTSTSQIPAQWLKFATETIPIDIWRRFRTLRLLAPNTFALRYLRRLYNNLTSGESVWFRITAYVLLRAGATESLHITIHTSVGELLSQFPDGLTAPSLGYAGESYRSTSPATTHTELCQSGSSPSSVTTSTTLQ